MVGKGVFRYRRKRKVGFFAKVENKKECEKILKDLMKELDQLLDRYSFLRFDFQKRAEVLKRAVKGRLKMSILRELWEKDRELYREFWSLLELFRVVELPQQEAVELIVPGDVADFVRKICKVCLGGKLEDGS